MNTPNVKNMLSISPYQIIVPYEKGSKIVCGDFTITFLGINDVTSDTGAIISLQTTDFKVESKDGQHIEILKIGNGQLPNPPREFSVGGKTFTLHTYLDPANVKLPSQTFFITEN